MWALSVLNGILGLQPRDKAAMLDDNAIEFFLRNLHEIGLSSQRREMLLFVSSKVAATKSRANQQYEHLLTKTPSKEVQQSINTINEYSSIFPYTSSFKYATSTKSHSISQNVASPTLPILVESRHRALLLESLACERH